MRDTPESSLEPLRVTAAKTEAQMEMTAYFRRHIHVEGHHGFRFSFAFLGGKLLKTVLCGFMIMAERVGFEPTVRFPVRSLSRRVL